MADTVINVQNLTKIYPLYDRHIDRFKEALNPRRKKYHHDFYALRAINFEVKKEKQSESLERMVPANQPCLRFFPES